MSSSGVKPVLDLFSHERCFEPLLTVRIGNEVGESGCALMDGLYSGTADDRVSVWAAGVTVTGRRCHFEYALLQMTEK